MKGPDGAVYPMGGVCHEIVEPERIVFTTTALHNGEGVPSLETRTRSRSKSRTA